MGLTLKIENLANVNVDMIDGNYAELIPDVGNMTLIIGTGTDGPTDCLIPMPRPGDALQLFGDGTLGQGIIEAARGGAPFIAAWRIGGTPAKIEHIGDSTGAAGITVETVQGGADAGDKCYITWDNTYQRLIVWNENGEKLYDNDATNPIDSGLVVVSGEAAPGGGPSFGTIATGEQMSTIAAMGTVYTAGSDGLSPTRKKLYELLHEAYASLLSVSRIFSVIVPQNIYLDDLNITDDDTLAGSGKDYLGYLKTEYTATTGEYTFTWTDIVAGGYHQVNFAYQLANFCYIEAGHKGGAIGSIGVRPPISTARKHVNMWIGEKPTKNDAGLITVNGCGLLGNKFMTGKIGHAPGFYATDNGELDGDELEDAQNNFVDIGKFLMIPYDWGVVRNQVNNTTGYITTLSSSVGGLRGLSW